MIEEKERLSKEAKGKKIRRECNYFMNKRHSIEIYSLVFES